MTLDRILSLSRRKGGDACGVTHTEMTPFTCGLDDGRDAMANPAVLLFVAEACHKVG